MLGNLFSSLGMKIATGAALALLVALGVVMWRADAISADREALRDKLALSEARHAVTRQSVETLAGEMKRLVAEGEVRKERVDKAMEQVGKDTAPLRAEAERIAREGLGEDYAERLKESGI